MQAVFDRLRAHPRLLVTSAGLAVILAVLFNLTLILIPQSPGRAIIEQLAATNLFFGVGGLLPIPSIDGEVIWRELLRSSRQSNRL